MAFLVSYGPVELTVKDMDYDSGVLVTGVARSLLISLTSGESSHHTF
jgi:hypothetical protein